MNENLILSPTVSGLIPVFYKKKIQMDEENWYEFWCQECNQTWESTQSVPDREWCSCGTPEEPVLVGIIEQ